MPPKRGGWPHRGGGRGNGRGGGGNDRGGSGKPRGRGNGRGENGAPNDHGGHDGRNQAGVHNGRGRGRGGHSQEPETPEQVKYKNWKRIIKNNPLPNDINTIQRLWTLALEVLDGEDMHPKQKLPHDLGSGEYPKSLAHVETLMGMNIYEGGSRQFVELSRPFLLVITHRALLNCLAVDTSVGNLYNFITGANGTRAVPFLQRVCTHLIHYYVDGNASSTVFIEETLCAVTKALQECLKREQRSRFNDDLSDLFDTMEDVMGVAGIMEGSETFLFVTQKLLDFSAIVARAQGLLQEEEAPQVNGVSTAAVVSTYPMPINVPGTRHDNDKREICDIQLLPTEGEVRSDHAEFLPSTDRNQPHFLTEPVLRHLDTHFRLLRHDIFGELKEALSVLIREIEDDQEPTLNFKKIRAYAYKDARVTYVGFEREELDFQISFLQPFQARKKSKTVRTAWWKETKRLEEGALLCLLSQGDDDGQQSSLLFLTVSKKQTEPNEENGLTSNDKIANITVKLATKAQGDLERILRLNIGNTPSIMIELPNVILATFTPILECLQRMYQLGRLPFRQWILPERTTTIPQIPPPLYARKENFRFSLKSILKNGNVPNVLVDPQSSPNDQALVDRIAASTTLDRGQCEALIAALAREFAQIQGPPGTGKSYLGVNIMRVLLDSAKELKIGPIIVACYTNHALDQFLEHLLDIGIEKIIRIGGSSKSTRLEGKNLRVIVNNQGKTKYENWQIAKAHEEMEQKAGPIKSRLNTLYQSSKKRPSWNVLQRHLSENYRLIHDQFVRGPVEEDGFQKVSRREPFDVWLDGTKNASSAGNARNIQQLIDVAASNVNALSARERIRLVEFWRLEMQQEASDELYEMVKFIDKQKQYLSNVYNEVDRRVLQTAQVIGVTTTGLAKKIATLQHVESKVLIVEEAGEIMEPHLLTALLPSVEHVISIGDHEQLRPQINFHKALSIETTNGQPYQLDRSQFERLSVGEPDGPKFPISQLNVQRRMRPQISNLIRATLYPRLIDHADVKELPDVVGIRDNVFWFNHENNEDEQPDGHQKSFSNLWEVGMTFALVRHIVRQGKYSSSDIAVLTPYTGQLQKLRAKFRSEFEIVLSDRDQEQLEQDGFAVGEGEVEEANAEAMPKKPLAKKTMSELLRIGSVDNFQGEEASVVVVSLVRSNQDKKVGFLKTSNRINVLLSRAKHGMYLIGNMETYSNIKMWKNVIAMLRAQDSVGEAFNLCCPRHPDTLISVSCPEDFARLSPEGGCQLVCNRRLSDCGHQCLARCHSDAMHEVFACPKLCERIFSPCNHSCQKATCGEDCGNCKVKVDNILLPCGHLKNGVECYQTQESNLLKIKCTVLVDKTVPGCGHLINIQCCEDVEAPRFSCPAPCGDLFECGHLCPGSCGRCNRKDQKGERVKSHPNCRKICERPFGTCNHRCPMTCHEGIECRPCPIPCEVRCIHSGCIMTCAKPCAPCIEKCSWTCEHQGNCTMPCSAPCNRLPCDKRCSKLLSCGHQCPSLCGEICPQGYCQACNEKPDSRVDLLEMKEYHEVDLNETPIVVLGCGHFFTMETLDGIVGLSSVYELDRTGTFSALKDISTELAGPIPKCPDCQCPIRQFVTQRYNRVINRAVMDEMSKRFLVIGQQGLHDFEVRIEEMGQNLEKSKETILRVLQLAPAHTQLAATRARQISELLKLDSIFAFKLNADIENFKASVANKHQPAQKLHDAIVTARRNRSVEEQLSDLNVSETPLVPRDQRVTFGVRAIKLKTAYMFLSERLVITQALRGNALCASIKIPGKPTHEACNGFLKECRAFIGACNTENLPKLAVEATLYFAKSARALQSFNRALKLEGVKKSDELVIEAKKLLEHARKLCEKPFGNRDALLKAIEDTERILGKEWYEEVSKEELESIKAAMVSGPGGIATHSGHWYNCTNGHPFAIGDCGMPMQTARCLECGAPIGGRNHQAVDGVTRAMEMER